MKAQTKFIRNPLTIIAVFAGLAEVASTVALATVDKQLQYTFVWFVMLFPVLLVVAFFLTLNFNPRVLYAPSDFKNEDNFVTILRGTHALSADLSEVAAQLEATSEAVERLRVARDSDRERLAALVTNELTTIRTKLLTTRQNVERIVEVTDDIRTWPHTKPCPKCGATMDLNHDDGCYGCKECKHWE